LISLVEQVDEYEGAPLKPSERALTYSITYQAPDRTLKEEEVTKIHNQVLEKLKKSGAAIRA